MKFLLSIALSLLIFSLSSYAFASKDFKITCDRNSVALSDQFIANQWTKTIMPWYASWAQDEMGGNYTFGGGMRTIEDKYPRDPNPHLTFIRPVVIFDDERGEVIMCEYAIHNPELMDIDNVLQMRAFTYLPNHSCHVTSSDSITCKE